MNGKGLIKIFIISLQKNEGNVVCLCPSKIHLPRAVTLFDEGFKSMYLLKCTRNPSDFELPSHLICLLCSYPWPFYNVFDENLINLFHLTFPGKGLKRSCTLHEGSFEMIGERNSKQSTGSLLILPKKVNEHPYYRERMNLNLLPHARNIINELMEQTIMAGYSSGESIMHFMKRNLHKRDAKTICYNTIITQRNFYNTIHLDKKSIFSEDSKQKVLNHMMLDHHIKKDVMRIDT